MSQTREVVLLGRHRIRCVARATYRDPLEVARGFCRGNEVRRKPGAAPPHAPAKAATQYVLQAKFMQLFDVLAGEPQVYDGEPTARAQHTSSFLDSLSPTRAVGDVVDNQTTDDHIDAVVIKR